MTQITFKAPQVYVVRETISTQFKAESTDVWLFALTDRFDNTVIIPPGGTLELKFVE